MERGGWWDTPHRLVESDTTKHSTARVRDVLKSRDLTKISGGRK